jgi:hypothetical protein
MGCCPTTLVQHGEPCVTVPPNTHLHAPHCAWPYGVSSSTSPVSSSGLEMADEQLRTPRADYDLVVIGSPTSSNYNPVRKSISLANAKCLPIPIIGRLKSHDFWIQNGFRDVCFTVAPTPPSRIPEWSAQATSAAFWHSVPPSRRIRRQVNTSFSCGWELESWFLAQFLQITSRYSPLNIRLSCPDTPQTFARNVLFAFSRTYRVELPLSSEQVLVPNPQIREFLF